VVIEPLSAAHRRKLFDCGEEEGNRFLHEQALQDAGKELSRTMVLVDEVADPARVVGNHTLLFMQVRQAEITQDRPKIKRPIPVILLGQLGVDRDFQRRGYGDLLLMDAQARVHEISLRASVRALVLDARNERLACWYESHDFIRFPGQLRLFKAIDLIRKLNLYP
jgi:GNAT superfamily N-acetyltransferase